ncbi:MAG: phosphonate ABC transporter, permease protein PhnE [Verrucomicrobia bacterium]|nr:phosphonate ABC transporter, permease protein PhnE [Verrucomicrobiota bacterium]
MRTPKKSKFVRPHPVRDQLQAIRPRFLAFMLDWATWGFVAYAVMFFLQEYWWRYIDFYNPLKLPPWGWPLAIFGTLEMALITRSFFHTPGMAAFGVVLVGENLEVPSLGQRLMRFLRMNAMLVAQPIVFLLRNRPPERLLHDSPTTGIVVPGAVLKDIAPARKPRPWLLTYRGIFIIGLLGVTVWIAWLTSTMAPRMLVERWPYAARIWGELVDVRFEYLLEPVNPRGLLFSIAYHMIETIFLALFATALGTLIAFPLSFLAARNIMGFSTWGWGIYLAMRFVFNAIRSIESLLIAVIFAIWVGFGNPFAGSLALLIHTVAALGKLFSEQVESVDPGPLEAIAASGARRWQIVIFGVIPQIIPSYLAFTLYRWDINIRMATIIALVGGGGIGTLLFYWKNEVGRPGENAWGQVGAVVIAIIVVVWLMDYISGRIREKIG